MDSGQVMTPLMSGFEMQVMMMLFILVMGMIMMMLATMTKIYNFHHDHHFKVLHLERLCNRTVRPCRAQEDEFPGETLPSSSFAFATISSTSFTFATRSSSSFTFISLPNQMVNWSIRPDKIILRLSGTRLSLIGRMLKRLKILSPSSQTTPPCSFQI